MPTLGVFAQGSAAKLYLPVRSQQGASLTNGYAVALAIGGNSFDGNAAVLAASGTTADLPGFIGVAAADIANTSYGLVQCWGFALSALISQVGSSITINQGNPLFPGALAGGLFSGAAPTYANGGFKYLLASNVPAAISASAYLSGLVRCL